MRKFFIFGLIFIATLAAAEYQAITINAGAAPASLDPAKVESTVEAEFLRNIFETLIITDKADRPAPGAAVSWEHSEDYLTWTFHLRPEARWSNGDRVVAGDFVLAWQRLVDPKVASPQASFLGYLKLKNVDEIISGKLPPQTLGIEARDDLTLILHLSGPVSFIPEAASFFILAPVPSKVVAKYGEDWARPEHIVGNGAFKLDSLVMNEEARLVKNPNYHGAVGVRLAWVKILQIPNESVEFARYRAGELDVSGFPLELSESVKKDYAGELKSSPLLCTYYFLFNTAKPPLDDPRIRLALSMSLDRELITGRILKTGQLPAYHFTPPYANAAGRIFRPDWAGLGQEEKNKGARQLLAEAGFSAARPLSLTLPYNTNETHKRLAIAAASMWAKNLAGAVRVKLANQEWKSFLSSLRLGEYELARGGWCGAYNEASAFLNIFKSDSSNNRANFKNPDYDTLLARAGQAKNEDEREGIYAQLEALLAKQVPVAPVYFYTQIKLIKPRIKGYVLKPSLSTYFKDVWVEEPKSGE